MKKCDSKANVNAARKVVNGSDWAALSTLSRIKKQNNNNNCKSNSNNNKVAHVSFKFASGTDEEYFCKKRIGKQQKSGKLIGPNFCGQLPL